MSLVVELQDDICLLRKVWITPSIRILVDKLRSLPLRTYLVKLLVHPLQPELLSYYREIEPDSSVYFTEANIVLDIRFVVDGVEITPLLNSLVCSISKSYVMYTLTPSLVTNIYHTNYTTQSTIDQLFIPSCDIEVNTP